MSRLWIPLFLLASISTLILLYQWDQAEQAQKNGSPSSRLDVTMTVKEEELKFEYTYEELNAGIYVIKAPDQADNFECTIKDRPCRVVQKDTPEMILEQGGEVLVEYTIPALPGGANLTDWMMELKKEAWIDQTPFSLTIKDYATMEDPWLVPTAKSDDIRLDNLRYYKFPSLERSLPLVRKGESSIWAKGESVITYMGAEELSDGVKQAISRLLNDTGPVMIRLDQSETSVNGKLLQAEGRNVKELQGAYVLKHLKKVTKEEQPWEYRIIKDIWTGPETTMGQEVTAALTADELEKWKEYLLQADRIEDLGRFLDDKLALVYGMNTVYFQNHEKATSAKLYFREEKTVSLEDRGVTDHVISYQRSSYLSLKDISRIMKYELETIEEGVSYRVGIPGKDYRFYISEPTFIVDQEQFGIGDGLLIMVKDTPYIRIQDLRDLFEVSITVEET